MVKQNIVGALREQSDWEQQDENRLGFIKNKPFYDTRKTETAPLILEFDGNIDGRETVDATATMGAYYVKLSDLTPTCEELNGGTLVFYSEGSVETMTIEGTIDRKAYGTTLREMLGAMVVVEGAFIDDYGAYFSSGLWVLCSPGEAWTKKIYLPSCSVIIGELKTIDPKFLPNGMGSGFATVTLTTAIPMSGSLNGTFSEEESVNLTAVYESGNPVLITVPTEAEFSIQALACRVLEAKGFMLTLPMGEVLLCVGLMDAENTGTWTYRVSGTPMTSL